MPLLIICPCGHSGPLPEETKTVTCSVCSRKLRIDWFSNHSRVGTAWQQWQVWRIKSGIVLNPPAEQFSVELRVS